MYSKIWSVENQSAIPHIHPRIDRCLGLANPKFEPSIVEGTWPRKEGGPRASLENLKWEGGSEVRDV
jgi:hypothetical protein